MWNYKQTLVISILTAANLAYASDISYDQQNITPQGWQEVDLSYVHKINGKDYIEQAKLLRPTSWLEQYHLDKVGRLVRVNESDVGIDATVRVVAVKPNKLYFESQNYQSAHPVIGTFLKYSDDVWSYTFTSGETIEATSNHPFYDVDKKQYIPIGEFQINGDQLLTDNNAKVQLYSKTKHNKGVEAVYNFEVYQAHNYYVSQNNCSNGVLVHNPNGANCSRLTPEHLAFMEDNTDIMIYKNEKNQVAAYLHENKTIKKNFPGSILTFDMTLDNSTWVFNITTRRGLNDSGLYASHYTTYLIEKAKEMFPELLTFEPKNIIRKNIINKETLTTLYKLGQAPEHDTLLKTFLSSTPNGKHTQRILDIFGLKATSIEVGNLNYNDLFDDFDPAPDITLKIKSIFSSVNQ